MQCQAERLMPCLTILGDPCVMKATHVVIITIEENVRQSCLCDYHTEAAIEVARAVTAKVSYTRLVGAR